MDTIFIASLKGLLPRSCLSSNRQSACHPILNTSRDTRHSTTALMWRPTQFHTLVHEEAI